MSRKRLQGVLIVCLVLVAANPTANGDTLSEEQKEVLITGLLEKGYKQDEIPGLIELAGLAGGPSISQDARRVCLEILYPPKDTTPKQEEKAKNKTSPQDKQVVGGLISQVEELEKEGAVTFSRNPVVKYKEILYSTGLEDFVMNVYPSRNNKQLEISVFDFKWHSLTVQGRKQLVQALYKLWKSVNPKGESLAIRITSGQNILATIGDWK